MKIRGGHKRPPVNIVVEAVFGGISNNTPSTIYIFECSYKKRADSVYNQNVHPHASMLTHSFLDKT